MSQVYRYDFKLNPQKMIIGFEEETAPFNEDEKALVRVVIKGLANHVGEEEAIKGRAICLAVSQKYTKLTEARLRKIINFIRAKKILPVIATSRGYYISHDKDVIKREIESLRGRQAGIQAAIDGLEKWL